MSISEKPIKSDDLKSLRDKNIFWNLHPDHLIEKTIQLNQGMLTDTGTLAVNTGTYTGRSPKDKFIVEDEITKISGWRGWLTSPHQIESLVISSSTINLSFGERPV